MTKRNTPASRRREALLQKKLEKRNAVNFPDDEDLLDEQLVTLGIAGGYCRFLNCDSTNDFLKTISQRLIVRERRAFLPESKRERTYEEKINSWLEEAMVPKALPFVVTADEQTAGRGRRNNTWWTGTGSLALSMLLDAKQHGLKPETSAQLSLGIGFAVMQALRGITEETLVKSNASKNDTPVLMPNIEIRWPNDVYVNDRKITGILIESPNMRHVIIGIGVNTNNSTVDAPEEIRDKIVTLSDVLGQKIDQYRFIFLLCQEIMKVLDYFPSHLPQLTEKIEVDLRQTGKMVNISREDGQITGRCLGLNADGSLRVLTETGEKAVVSGVIL